jgi:hypothetical protein
MRAGLLRGTAEAVTVPSWTLLAGHAERITAQLRQAERDLAELTGRVAGPVRLAAFQKVMRKTAPGSPGRPARPRSSPSSLRPGSN